MVVRQEIRRLSEKLVELDPGAMALAGQQTRSVLGKAPLIYPTRAWKSRRFVVQLYEEPHRVRLSVQRAGANAYIRPQNRDRRPISWEELMEVKRDVGFGDCWAVEVYPPEEDAVNVSDMRHLWLVDDVPFAWRRSDGPNFFNNREA